MTALSRPHWVCRVCERVVRSQRRPSACFGCGTIHSHRPATTAPGAALAPLERSDELPCQSDAPEAVHGPPTAPVVWADDVPETPVERARSGWAPWAAVTGELARGYVTLVTGPRGAGKTRAVDRAIAGVSAVERRAVVHGTGEQAARDLARVVARYAAELERTHRHRPRVALLPTRRVEDVLAAIVEHRAICGVFDGIQTFTFGGKRCLAGSSALAGALDAIAASSRRHDWAAVIVPHMTSGSEKIGGGALLQQLADTIVRLSPVELAADASDTAPALVRLSIDGKNRNGPVTIRRTLKWTADGTLIESRAS